MADGNENARKGDAEPVELAQQKESSKHARAASGARAPCISTAGTQSLGAFYAGDCNFIAKATAQASVLSIAAPASILLAPTLNPYALTLLTLLFGLGEWTLRQRGQTSH